MLVRGRKENRNLLSVCELNYLLEMSCASKKKSTIKSNIMAVEYSFEFWTFTMLFAENGRREFRKRQQKTHMHLV